MLSDNDVLVILEENFSLKNLVQKQENTLLNKDVELLKKAAEIQQKQERIKYLERLIFGQKRERFITTTDAAQLSIFEIDQAQVEQAVENMPIETPTAITEQKTKKNHPGRHKLPQNMEVREMVIEPQGDLSSMVHVGNEITEILETEPAKYYIHRIIRPKYAPKSGEGSFLIADLPPRFNNKSIAGTSIITQAIIDKYADHLPIYRQLQRFARADIQINETSLYNWVQQGLKALKILYDYQWESQVRCRYLQVDETTLKVLESEKKNATHLGYYWVYNDPVRKIPVFKYEKGRSGAFPAEQLKDFVGYLQTDGYAGYNALAQKESITHLACWAHARREFDKALPNDKPRATIAMQWIQQLYQIEKEIETLTTEQKKEIRLDKSLPVCNAFFKWAAQEYSKVLPKSQIGKALNYAIHRLEPLTNYLKDGSLKIDNNAVENSIRPVAIGRKNYLFAKTHQTAQNAAIIYTFLAICKTHNVNPSLWLKYVLDNISETSIQNLSSLLPQNFKKS